jgi:GMP synthase-like glutamine amidotransferase
MKPVVIFRHAATEGPGYFATFLEERAVPMELIKIDEGIALPHDASPFSGLVFMGGPMSVNDDLPWIPQSLALIRDAVARDIPVLGHCLGGQLMAKAMGGVVGRNPIKEIGWGEVTVLDNPAAHAWFNDMPATFESFHWHGETFSIPQGATCILESAYCINQAFVLGKHLGMQCHVEMTEAMIKSWCAVGAGEIAAALTSPAVHTAEVIQQGMATKVNSLNQIAGALYGRWIAGLAG